jgi:SAM-dependent methyltransferase
MSERSFDAGSVFDEDYLDLFAGTLEAHSDAEADLIWRLLDLQPGLEVLDLACGHGRIANRLAARGCIVTGLDSSEVFLHRARADAQARGVSVNYVHGDMRELPWPGRFDRVVNWFTAFGYFSDAQNHQVLAQIAGVLKPGGRLGIELSNYPSLMRRYLPSVVTSYEAGLVIDEHKLDPVAGHSVVTRRIVRNGTVRKFQFFVRLFTFPELRDWLLAAGFSRAEAVGEDGEPLTAEHRRMITLAAR